MLERINDKFSDSETQFIIQEVAKKYQLSQFEYLSLIDILLYYFCISSQPDTLHITKLICDKITIHRDRLALNQTNDLFVECLAEIIKQEITIDKNAVNNIETFIREGIIFHSFNATFFDKINTQGLVVKDKPWSLDDIESIRKLFQKYGKGNIFGLYQGRSATPIFFANALVSSPYYALSSPTFFRKFIENKKEYFNVFLNRDYPSAKKSIEELCSNLSLEEQKQVFDFFNKYWSLFTNGELPYVAISTKEKLGIESQTLERRTDEDLIEYYVRCLLQSNNYMIKDDIPREKLELFSYGNLSIIPKEKEKNI